MSNLKKSTAVLVCSLLCLFGCSPQTDTNTGGIIPPVQVPGAASTASSSPPISIPINNDAEQRRAEEAFSVACAKALAFSHEVQMYRQRYYESLAKQFGNQVAQNQFLPQPGQFQRARHRRTFLNPDGSPTSGDIAGEQYLKDEAKRLNQEAQEYLEKTDLAIQQEAWRRLNAPDRVLVAKFDLIPQRIRESDEKSADKTEREETSRTENNPSELFWSAYPIPDSEFQIDFPSVVSKASGGEEPRYTSTAGSVVFNVEWPKERLQAPGLSNEQILIAETDNIAAAQSQQGKAVARRTAKLGDFPAEELCVFYKQDRRELATYARFAVIDGKFVSVQVNDLDANDERHSVRFLDSFRRRLGEQK